MTTRKNKPIKRKRKTKTKKSKTKKSKTKRKNAPNKLEPITELGRGLEGMINKLIDPISYAPTINKELISLKSINREDIPDCNNELAFQLKEPLQIGETNKSLGYKCYPYTSTEAKDIMLKNLAANKHLDVSKIVPPKQILGNCWFNTFFVTFFVSDKGRKFFHFFRQLMIEGKQTNQKIIPTKIRDAFALLNYAIDACLTGSKYAYVLDTNSIIREIYNNIPKKYKKGIINVRHAGNPIRYYEGIISYLNNNSLKLLRLPYNGDNWKTDIIMNANKKECVPHIIILEVYDGLNNTAGISGTATNKPLSFSIKGGEYMLDSCIIRDTKQNHFCATITCENKEMAYDGMSFHRLVDMEWKKNINNDLTWEFEGSTDNRKPLKWNFMHGYQLLFYYRVS